MYKTQRLSSFFSWGFFLGYFYMFCLFFFHCSCILCSFPFFIVHFHLGLLLCYPHFALLFCCTCLELFILVLCCSLSFCVVHSCFMLLLSFCVVHSHLTLLLLAPAYVVVVCLALLLLAIAHPVLLLLVMCCYCFIIHSCIHFTLPCIVVVC
jgi:hypothetical protein